MLGIFCKMLWAKIKLINIVNNSIVWKVTQENNVS